MFWHKNQGSSISGSRYIKFFSGFYGIRKVMKLGEIQKIFSIFEPIAILLSVL